MAVSNAKLQGRYRMKECLDRLIPMTKITAQDLGVDKQGHIHFCQQPLDGLDWQDEDGAVWFCYWESKKRPSVEPSAHITVNDAVGKRLEIMMRDNTVADFEIQLVRDARHKSGKLLLKKIN